MKAICIVIIMLIPITVFASEEEKDYRYYFSNRELREKFGLYGSGDEYYYRMQRKYDDARERDYQILRDMMEEDDSGKD